MCVRPELSDLDLTDIEIAAVDLETWDPDLKTKGSGAITSDGKNSYVVGIAIATRRQTLYFPIRHKYKSQQIDPKLTWRVLNKKLFQNPNIKKVFHNAMYDVCWIRAETGLMPRGLLLDTMVAASLIDENRLRYSLDSLAKDYLQETKYKYDLKEKSEASPYFITDPMSNMHKLPYELVKDYAEQDVNLTLKLWNLFEKKIKAPLYTNDKGEVKSLSNIFNLETDLFPCLVEMRFKGVRIDVEKAKQVGIKLKKRSDNIIKIIKKRTGIKIDMWAAASIKKLLDKLKIKDYEETPKSKMPQLPKDYLQTHENRFLRFIAKARECDKAQSAFIEGLLKYVHKGRIHAEINQIRSEFKGTVTGRFSMSNPNLQQIPAKGLIGKKMRELFLPEEGYQWGSFDYSQQEPRLVVHYALKNKLPGADILGDAYNKDPATDFHKIVAEMAGITRTTAKTINLGLFYGMGKLKLAAQLNLDKDEARKLFNNYHSKVPFVRNLSQGLQDFGVKTQLIYTLEDRFCRFNKWEPKDKKWNNKKRIFTITRKEGEEWIEKAVPILTREEAEKDYHSERAKSIEASDPQLLEFEGRYQPAFTYKALNKLIQGSAADTIKKAMVLLFKAGIIPQIQIHDELCISIKNKEEAVKVKNIMENAVRLAVPNKVDYAVGLNWGNIKQEELWKK
jgi:DNA polymerase I-like protein with 3'-5' exonuclease and polymerase domains